MLQCCQKSQITARDNKTFLAVIFHYFNTNDGSITAKTPITILAITYIIAITTEPLFINSAVSRENVEKVVKPPHIPTFKKSNNLGSMFSFFDVAKAKHPIANAPIIFMIKVLIGNDSGFLIGIKLIKYLNTAPINPPKPTAKQFIIFSSSTKFFTNIISYKIMISIWHVSWKSLTKLV